MRLQTLKLRDFRNASEVCFTPGPGVNLLAGRNAQGKTNIIEAIALLATGQSFRAPDFRDMIRWDAPSAEVAARTRGAAGDDELRVAIDPRRKLLTRNEKRVTVASPTRFYAVLFAPEEILLLKGAPAGRRRYIDSLLFQLSHAHRSDCAQYEKVVRQRNRLLQESDRSPSARTAALAPWDQQLVELGSRIVTARRQWCERLNALLPGRYSGIAPDDGRACFVYVPHCGAAAANRGQGAVRARLAAQLAERRSDEMARGISLVGPHRDDLEAAISGSAVRNFGSQGQHRSFVLALKLAEMDLLRTAAGGEEPILLLDDVASELDAERNSFFFETLAAATGQVFITATAASDVRLPPASAVAQFEVSAGAVTPRK